MSIYINRDHTQLPEEVKNFEEQGFLFHIKPSNLKGMEPLLLAESAEKMKAVYDLGIDTFNPNILVIDRGQAAIAATINSNAILMIECSTKICLLNLHQKQMRTYKNELLRQINEYLDRGSVSVTVFLNDDTWDMNSHNVALFKQIKGITEYKAQYTSPGAEVIVY